MSERDQWLDAVSIRLKRKKADIAKDANKQPGDAWTQRYKCAKAVVHAVNGRSKDTSDIVVNAIDGSAAKKLVTQFPRKRTAATESPHRPNQQCLILPPKASKKPVEKDQRKEEQSRDISAHTPALAEDTTLSTLSTFSRVCEAKFDPQISAWMRSPSAAHSMNRIHSLAEDSFAITSTAMQAQDFNGVGAEQVAAAGRKGESKKRGREDHHGEEENGEDEEGRRPRKQGKISEAEETLEDSDEDHDVPLAVRRPLHSALAGHNQDDSESTIPTSGSIPDGVLEVIHDEKIFGKILGYMNLQECFGLLNVHREFEQCKVLRQRLMLDDHPRKLVTASVASISAPSAGKDAETVLAEPEGAGKDPAREQIVQRPSGLLTVNNLPRNWTRLVRGNTLPGNHVRQINPLVFGGQDAVKNYIHNFQFYPAAERAQVDKLPPSVAGPEYQIDRRAEGLPLKLNENGDNIQEQLYEMFFVTHTAENFRRDPKHLNLEGHCKQHSTLAQSLLVQPAINDVQVLIHAIRHKKTGGIDHVYGEEAHVHNHLGIRMGDIFQKAVEWSKRYKDKGARIGQHISYTVRFPRGVRLNMAGYKQMGTPLTKAEFDAL
ncbi:Hypothetical predicted protein [Lecanosticta acicola]|uniref:Uncharacterized protein n=1 Tax=Lecanosticta acicola TaxID=111012 RepID=A0AAI8Z5L3_9PEZI|nr:Hypothetical predicted protein [Lecanosticta acicola]